MALPLDKLNKLLRTAALGVEVVQTKSKGRGIVATRAHRAAGRTGPPLAYPLLTLGSTRAPTDRTRFI